MLCRKTPFDPSGAQVTLYWSSSFKFCCRSPAVFSCLLALYTAVANFEVRFAVNQLPCPVTLPRQGERERHPTRVCPLLKAPPARKGTAHTEPLMDQESEHGGVARSMQLEEMAHGNMSFASRLPILTKLPTSRRKSPAGIKLAL